MYKSYSSNNTQNQDMGQPVQSQCSGQQKEYSMQSTGAELPMQSQYKWLEQQTAQKTATGTEQSMQIIPSTIQQMPIPIIPPTAEQTVRFSAYEELPMLPNIPVTTESIQYLNGFLRTQIGRHVKVDFLVGTNTFIDKEGTLMAVGINYILINEIDTDDITVCDFYNIKFIRFFY